MHCLSGTTHKTPGHMPRKQGHPHVNTAMRETAENGPRVFKEKMLKIR